MDPKRLGAFVEYCLRPLAEDVREILALVDRLQLPLEKEFLKSLASYFITMRIFQEILRYASYLAITWIVSVHVCDLLSRHPGF